MKKVDISECHHSVNSMRKSTIVRLRQSSRRRDERLVEDMIYSLAVEFSICLG